MLLTNVTPTTRSRFVIAEKLYNKGDYSGSLNVLNCEDKDSTLSHTLCSASSDNLLRARNNLCLHNDAEAWKYIKLIPEKISDYNPLIDADQRTVRGILFRRAAHRKWKRGDTDGLTDLVHQAIVEFNLASVSAQNASEHGKRLYYNARLNMLYARGLLNAINKAPQSDYTDLLVESVVCEYASRRSMTLDASDFVTGPTIIADLSRGAGVSIEQMRYLSDEPAYTKAFFSIFGREPITWPQYLYVICQYDPSPNAPSQVKDDTIAKALLLGMKMVLAETVPSSEMLHKYAYPLRYHLDMLARNSSSQKLREQICNLFSELPEDLYRLTVSYRVHR